MTRPLVSIVRYEKPLESVRKTVDLSNGLDHLPRNAKVFIKPNIVLWTRKSTFPKWGVITTSRVIEDMVVLLRERGAGDITIGEGMVLFDPKDRATPKHAFETLGYPDLRKRYGVRCVDIHDRPVRKVDLGADVVLNMNTDMLDSDFVVNIPVLKTHHLTVVSLGIKNLKGAIDIPSRKKCHNADPVKNLNYWIARLGNKLPPSFTLLDGIYTAERGPSVNGKIRRSDLLVGSADLLSADKVGARLLGFEASQVPHLVHAALDRDRPTDLSDVEIAGLKIEDEASPYEYDFPYNEAGTLPGAMVKMGIRGVDFRKYDFSICTYCAGLYPLIMASIMQAWKGTPYDEVEILTGKIMKPTPGKKTALLIGKCMYRAHKDNPDVKNLIAVKGCPPQPKALVKALHEAGIEADPVFLEQWEENMGLLMNKYRNKPEFDEAFFRIP